MPEDPLRETVEGQQRQAVERVVLVGHDNEGSRDILSAIVEAHPDLTFELVVTTGLYYRRSVASSIAKLLREASWSFCVRRMIDLVAYRVRRDTLVSRAAAAGIPVWHSKDVNDDATVAHLRSFAPDLLVSLFTMHLYREPVLAVPVVASIGSHPSKLPAYRGLEVFFWMLANGETEAAVSVFHLAKAVDAGEVLMQRPFPIGELDTVVSVYRTLTDVTGDLLAETIGRFRTGGTFEEIAPADVASYFPMPTREAWRAFRARGRRWS